VKIVGNPEHSGHVHVVPKNKEFDRTISRKNIQYARWNRLSCGNFDEKQEQSIDLLLISHDQKLFTLPVNLEVQNLVPLAYLPDHRIDSGVFASDFVIACDDLLFRQSHQDHEK